MAWAKAPVAIGAVACAACLAIAGTMTSSVPAVQHKAVDDLVKTLQRNVHLSALSDIDAFSALGLTDATGYGLFDAIPAFAEYAASQDLAAFEPAADGSGGYAALSGLNSYATGTLTGIDAFSNGGNVLASDAFSSGGNILATDAFSALPIVGTIADILSQENVDNKALATAIGSYGATSAVNTFFGNGSNLTFDADGNVLTTSGGVFTGGGIGALAPGPDGSGGYAALSAIPAYVGAIEDLNPPAQTTNVVAPQNRTMFKAATVQPNVEQPGTVQTNEVQNNVVDNTKKVEDTQQQVQPAGAVAPAASPDPGAAGGRTPSGSSGSSNTGGTNKNGSYAGVFKPGNGVIPLFGSGKGNGADNGIRGWGDMLKKAGLNGGDSGTGGGAPAGGGAAGGGEGGGTN